MTVSPKIDFSEALSRIEEIKREYDKLLIDVEQSGNDPEEVALLERLAEKIAEALSKASAADVSVDIDVDVDITIGGGGDDDDGPATIWNIDVEVKDASGDPLPGAEIVLGGDQSETHTSDQDGFTRFRIDGGGKFEVQASFDGVSSGKESIDNPEPMNQDVRDVVLQVNVERPGINPPETPPGIDPPETPPGTNPPGVLPPVEPVAGTWSIRATVKDHEGANASGVEVRLMGPSNMSMATDGSGIALFDVQEPGRYMVQAITEHSESDPVMVEENNPTEGSVVDAELQLIGAPEDPFTAPTESEEPTIRKGDEDADGWVEYLQKLLNKHLSEAGEAKISVSGTFDSATDGAVRWFQGYTECLVDGIVGNQTWSALREDHERKAIGTDGREPGSHSETGAEGRWLLESGRMGIYDEAMDTMTFTIASVGTEPIKGFSMSLRNATALADTIAG